MKKLIIASTLSLLAMSTFAVEVGLIASHENVGSRNGAGVVVSQQVGSVSVSGEAERFTKGMDNQNRYTVLAKVPLRTFGSFTANVGGGFAYLDSTTMTNGYTLVGSVGVATQLTKDVSLGLDFRKQYSRGVTRLYNGYDTVLAVKYSF